jgi:hypothetical protein
MRHLSGKRGLWPLLAKIQRAIAAGAQCVHEILDGFYIAGKLRRAEADEAHEVRVAAPERVIAVRLD